MADKKPSKKQKSQESATAKIAAGALVLAAFASLGAMWVAEKFGKKTDDDEETEE